MTTRRQVASHVLSATVVLVARGARDAGSGKPGPRLGECNHHPVSAPLDWTRRRRQMGPACRPERSGSRPNDARACNRADRQALWPTRSGEVPQ